MSRQVDNSNVAAKLALRRGAIAEAEFPTVDVLDLCAGAGHLWKALRRDLEVRRYLPCDRAPRLEGTIRGEASVLAGSLDLATFNVIDIDTYGEPWEPLLIAAERIRQETIFFLTHGLPNIGAMGVSNHVKRAAGLPTDWKIPFSITLSEYLSAMALSSIWRYVTVVSARRVQRPRVSYWALRVRPRRGRDRGSPQTIKRKGRDAAEGE